MNAPFRDLFVELPRAVFEALQGIGEQAVKHAEVRAAHARPRRPTLVEWLHSQSAEQMLCARYGWKRLDARRSAMDTVTWLTIGLACGHCERIEIDEFRLCSYGHARDGLDYVLDAIESHERRCFCVARLEAA